MRILDRGTVFSGEPGTDHQSCAFPGVCVLPSGRWMSTCRAASEKIGSVGQHALVTWSDDEGGAWHAPMAPFTPPSVDGKPGLFRGGHMTALGGTRVLATLCWVDHSDPSLPFFNEETEGLLDTRVFLAVSEDEGATWSEPALVDTSPFHIPTAITGPTLVLSDGAWMCQFELNKHYYDTAVWRHSSVLMFSRDAGKSFPEHVIASNDPENRIFYWDQRPGLLADGSLLDLFWTYDNGRAVYLNIHARRSVDNGRTWGPLLETNAPGQPAAPVSLPDGRIGMVYVDRTGAPVVKLRASEDGGTTWPDETELVLYGEDRKDQTDKKGSMQDAWAEMGKFSVGLPATALLGNGDLLVVYYVGPHTDQTDVQWVRVRTD
ncbi:MAG: sialidase family protein [Candidatus Latescibacterota bacterium]